MRTLDPLSRANPKEIEDTQLRGKVWIASSTYTYAYAYILTYTLFRIPNTLQSTSVLYSIARPSPLTSFDRTALDSTRA